MAVMNLSLTEEQRALRDGVTDICKKYPGEYWRALDVNREYPEAFVKELTESGYLGALIPEQYGGAGLGMLVCHNASSAMMFDVVRGRSTEVTAVFELDMNLRELRTHAKSLHFWST